MPIKDIVKNIDFFNDLSSSQVEKLSEISNIIKYSEDSILFYESERKDQLLFLISGLIKVYKVDKYGNEIFLYHICKNSMISEISSINDAHIYCFSNASFLEDSIVLSIDFQKFKKNFLEKNILTTKLIEVLLSKTHQLQCLINRELVFDATAKVAFMLNQDLSIFNNLKRQEVSFMLHIQPETLSRVLKRLSRSKTIKIEHGNIEILNQEELVSQFRGVAV